MNRIIVYIFTRRKGVAWPTPRLLCRSLSRIYISHSTISRRYVAASAEKEYLTPQNISLEILPTRELNLHSIHSHNEALFTAAKSD